MCASGYWFESEMQDQIGDLKLGYMAFPANKGDDKTKEVNTWYNAWSAMKSGDEAREAAALDFLRWIVSYEFQKAYVTDGGSTTSSNRKVMEEMAKDTTLSYFSQQVASTLADPNLTAYDSKYTIWYAQSFRVPEYTSTVSYTHLDIPFLPYSARCTVPVDTPASAAISLMVTRDFICLISSQQIQYCTKEKTFYLNIAI